MTKFSSTFPPFIIMLIILVLSLSTPLYTCATTFESEHLPARYLSAPVNDFVGSLNFITNIIRDVTATLKNFVDFFGDFRLSNAVADCLDLLDSSADALSWTMSAFQSPQGSKQNNTGDRNYDLRTWLSAALVNQDTCIQGLDGTNSILDVLVTSGLNQITSLVQQLLTQVEPNPNSISHGSTLGPKAILADNQKNKNRTQFPSWFKHKDRKLLMANWVTPDVVVAADGTGNFSTIMDAVEAAPEYSMRRFVIYIKKGVYNEYVEITKRKWHLVMVGEGMNSTIITGNHNYVDGWTTYRSATFGVKGIGFMARDIRFENTAGPAKQQAVAFRSHSDLSVCYRCEFRGYQDTLYTHTLRQFYSECVISGTVDFMFGYATAMFQNCQILVRKGLPKQKNTITAHGRMDPSQLGGFSLQFCNISPDMDLLPYINSTYTFLGRPWKNFSRTIFMQSYMSNVIRPEGWLEWNGSQHLDTLYYGEYMNYGPGAELENRVKWPGYHMLRESYEANNFTVAQFIKGDLWLPATGVRYTSGLKEGLVHE